MSCLHGISAQASCKGDIFWWAWVEGHGEMEGSLYQRDQGYCAVSLRSYANPLKSGLRKLLIVSGIVPSMMAKIWWKCVRIWQMEIRSTSGFIKTKPHIIQMTFRTLAIGSNQESRSWRKRGRGSWLWSPASSASDMETSCCHRIWWRQMQRSHLWSTLK